jgi:hypothetical protein
MSLRDNLRQNIQNLNTRRDSRPQPVPAQRDGTGVSIGGNRIRAANVTNEALGTGDAVVLSGDSGVVQQERRRVAREILSNRPIPLQKGIDVHISFMYRQSIDQIELNIWSPELGRIILAPPVGIVRPIVGRTFVDCWVRPGKTWQDSSIYVSTFQKVVGTDYFELYVYFAGNWTLLQSFSDVANRAFRGFSALSVKGAFTYSVSVAVTGPNAVTNFLDIVTVFDENTIFKQNSLGTPSTIFLDSSTPSVISSSGNSPQYIAETYWVSGVQQDTKALLAYSKNCEFYLEFGATLYGNFRAEQLTFHPIVYLLRLNGVEFRGTLRQPFIPSAIKDYWCHFEFNLKGDLYLILYNILQDPTVPSPSPILLRRVLVQGNELFTVAVRSFDVPPEVNIESINTVVFTNYFPQIAKAKMVG